MITTRHSFKIALFMLCLVLVLASCKDQIGNPPAPPPPVDNGGGQIVYDYGGFNATTGILPDHISITDSSGNGPSNFLPWESGISLVGNTGHGRVIWITSPTDSSEGGSIWVSNNTGTESVQIYTTTSDSLSAFPTISRDGSHVALLFREKDSSGEDRALVVYTLATVLGKLAAIDPHVITKTAADVRQTCFSPDGSRIVYYGVSGNTSTVEVANIDGSGKQILLTGVNSDIPENEIGNFAWSSNGDEIAFEDGAKLQVIHSDGSGLLTVDDSGMTPDWSPDGKTLAYSTAPEESSGYHIILTTDLGVTKHPLKPAGDVPCTFPQWSPDGRKILAMTYPPSYTSNSSVVVIDVATGATRIIATPGFGGMWLR